MKHKSSGRLLLVWLVSASLTSGGTVRAELSRAEITALFAEANEFFRQANEAASGDQAGAADLYRKAAVRFERIVREGRVSNGKLYYNLGNVYFCLNDLGHAILSYRRAEQFMANSPHLKQNLAYARQQRLDRIEGREKGQALKTLLWWQSVWSCQARTSLFVGTFLLVWVAAAMRLFFPWRFLSWCCGGAAVVALLLGGLLMAESILLRRERAGVIVQPEVIARKGDSETYESSFKEPLHAGTEFTLVESRPGWVYGELVDARRCWLPAKAVAFQK